MLLPLLLLLIYTLWSIKQLNYLSAAQALGVFALTVYLLIGALVSGYLWAFGWG